MTANWKRARLGDVAAIVRDIISPENIADGTSFVGLENIPTGGGFHNVRPVMNGDIQSAKFAFTELHVLYGKLRPYLAKISLPDFKGVCSTDILPVLPGKELDRRFLAHYLLQPSMVDKANSLATGANLPRLSPGALEDLELPLAPIDEQRRIADILDRADALRAKRRAALARLDELTQAIFIEMFGDPVSNPKGWPTTAVLGDVADIVSGVTKGRNLEGKTTRTLPYLAVANVQDKKLNLAAIKSIEATEDEIRRYRLMKNDLLLTEGGDPDKLGRGTLWQDELPECIHQNHIFRVRLNTDRVNSLFLNWLVGSERGKRYFLRSAKQTTGIASINMTQLRGFPLLLPPTALQNTFANCIAGIERVKSRHSAAQFEVDGLFASLQDRAFRGAL